MARRFLIAVTSILAAASPAFAGAAATPPAEQVSQPPAKNFLGGLFRRRNAHPFNGDIAFDTSAPVSIAKGMLPPPPAVRVLGATDVPLPHLRPRVRLPDVATGVAAEAPPPPASPRAIALSTGAATDIASLVGEPATLPAAVTAEVTGTIPLEPPTAAAALPPQPLPAPVAASPASAAPLPSPPREVAEGVQGDDLLGDVTTYITPQSHEMDPDVPSPDTVDIEMPGASGRVSLVPAVDLSVAAKPYELVRALQALQDQITQGSAGAITALRGLRSEIDRQFAAADPAVWQDRRNAQAAVTYVLSGGLPAILSRLATLDPKPAIDLRLVTGVLAYAEGNEADAANDLADVNPIELPASMGAQMALAQAALAVRSSPENAMRLLSIARLLAPGTLVEEAAIRRQLFVANQLKDDGMVESLSRQYLDRFRHSVYAGNFRQRFAAAMSRMDINDEKRFARLDDMLAAVEPEARCQLYLTVALASAIKNHLVAAALAADRALALSSAGSVDEARARLYSAAALAADAKVFDKAAADFGGVDRKLLRASDQAFYDTVAVTLDGIRSGTNRETMPQAAALPPEDPAAAKPPLVARATDALKVVDAMLLASK